MEKKENKAVLNGEPLDETPVAEPVEPTSVAQPQSTTPPPVNSQGGYNPNYTDAPVRPCPICGTEYTYVCPKCGFSPYVGRNNTKKNIFSKWWFWLIAVAVAFGLIIGTASCAMFLLSKDDTSTANYDTQPLCAVGDIDVKLVPESSYRDEYEIVLTVEVKNNGEEDFSFYPTKALLDGEKAMAYGDFSYEDSDVMWDYDSYYAKDGSTIIKSGKRHLVELRFSFDDVYYDDYDEERTESATESKDLREINALTFSLNIADSKSCEVFKSESLNFDLNEIKAEKKYYEYE